MLSSIPLTQMWIPATSSANGPPIDMSGDSKAHVCKFKKQQKLLDGILILFDIVESITVCVQKERTF